MAKKKKPKKEDPNRVDPKAVPVCEIWRLRFELHDAIVAEKWKTAKNRAKAITKLVHLAMDPATCRIGNGEPHLDGIYTVGTQHTVFAPADVRDVITEMNQLITLGKSGKWPKKKKKKG